MCMFNAKTSNLDSLSREAYKMVIKQENLDSWIISISIGDGKYFTPYQYYRFDKILEAKGRPYFSYSYFHKKHNVLNGGAIHCYREMGPNLKSFCKRGKYTILKVIGTDPVAYNLKDVAFRKIEVIEEIEL